MSQPPTNYPGAIPGELGMWFYITAANNGQPITDALLSSPYFYDNSAPGWYFMNFTGPGEDGWAQAPGYNTTYFNTGSNTTSMQVSLSWAGAWPQTQTY